MIKSRWRFTLEGTVLLGFGDWMSDSPDFPLEAQTQEARFVGGSWGAVWGRGNRLRSFSWSRVISYNSVAEAQSMMLELPPTLVTGVSGDLTVQVEDGGTYQIADFVVQSCTPSHRSDLKPAELLLEFSGSGGRQTTVTAF